MTATESGSARRGTRERILRALKITGGSTVLELAEQVDISPVTVRHHLSALKADGLVSVRAERRPVGRPHHVFSLTDTGEELFPRRYLNLSRRLLDHIKASMGSGAATRLLREMAMSVAAEQEDRLRGKSGAERMAALAEILEAEGFMVSWEEKSAGYLITEHNCPYRKLGKRHPDVCQFDHTLITAVLEAPVQRASCLLQGDTRCEYVVGSTPAGRGGE